MNIIYASLFIFTVFIICCVVIIPEKYKKFVWMFPATIIVLVFAYATTLQGEEKMGYIILYPIILLSIIFIIAYYLKVIFIISKNLSLSTKIEIWAGVVVVLTIVIIIVYEINAIPLREQERYEKEQNMMQYQTSKLISSTLSDYKVTKVSLEKNPDRDIEINSRQISLPFDVEPKSIIKVRGLLIVEGKELAKAGNNSNYVSAPAFIFFESKIISEALPKLKDEQMELFLNRAINFQRTYPTYASFSEIVKALNKVPKVEKDGSISSNEINSPEMMFKKELELAYRLSWGDLKIHRLVFDNVAINGLLFESSNIQMVEIFKDESLKYAFIVRQNEKKNKWVDYILTSIEKI